MRTLSTLLHPSHFQSEFSTSKTPNSSLILDQFQAENFPVVDALKCYHFQLVFVNISKYSFEVDILIWFEQRCRKKASGEEACSQLCWTGAGCGDKNTESHPKEKGLLIFFLSHLSASFTISSLFLQGSDIFVCLGAWKTLPTLADDRNRNALSWGLFSSTEQTFSASTSQFILSAWHCWTGCSDRQQVT